MYEVSALAREVVEPKPETEAGARGWQVTSISLGR